MFFPAANDGSVFAASSIAWPGSLSHNGYRNIVSRITKNVLDRFVRDKPPGGQRGRGAADYAR